MMRILMLAEKGTANTLNWASNLSCYGEAIVEIWSLPQGSSLRRFFYIPRAIIILRRRFKQFKPDILIGYRTTSYGFIGALTGFEPLVLAAQGESDVWPPGHWTNTISSFMARYAIRRASLIHVWGRNMVPALLKLGASSEQIMVMPRGIDLSKLNFKEPFSQSNKLTMIVSRSLYSEYHHSLILEAFAQVAKDLTGVDCKLIIAGDGPLKESLLDLAESLGISDSVLFVGRLEINQLSSFLGDSDLYVSLPDTEGISSSLLEAMASGCYPIVTNLPANQELIESGKNGKLVSLNVEEVVDAILKIWKNRENAQEVALKNRFLIESYADTSINSAKFVLRYKQLLVR